MMTKREQAEMDALRKEVRIARALRFSEPVEPDVPIPSGFSELSTGFYVWANGPDRVHHRSVAVDVACSSSSGHAFGSTAKTNSQGPRRLYSSRLLALKAGRADLARQCAESLAWVDEQIEKEEKEANAANR